jgi:hypothetical protein
MQNRDNSGDVAEAAERKQQEPNPRAMFIADLFLPSHITNHRTVRRGRGPAQLQFLVEWFPGWTADKSLAKKVIRKHPSEDLFFVRYRSSWEPYSKYYDTITPDMVCEYKTTKEIQSFGPEFDREIEVLSAKERQSLAAEDLYPNYQFIYKEAHGDPQIDNVRNDEPPLRKPMGRPKGSGQERIRQVVEEGNPDCGCKANCRNTFDAAYRKRIHTEFNELNDFATRSTWLSNLVALTPCPFRDTVSALELRTRARRKYTAKYFFLKKGLRIRVCKRFFQAVLGLGNTSLSNLNAHNFDNRSSQLVQRVDKRGAHQPKHAASEDDMVILKAHIFSFPREHSHYSLGSKEMLDPNLDVKKMWELYKIQETEQGRRVLLYNTYLKEFNKYDLKFRPYRVDTCHTCDNLRQQLGADPSREDLKAEKKRHLRDADMAYQMQKQDRLNSDDRTQAVWGDMQSVNQIPKLPTGRAFYKRKYKVYNEDFYLASSGQHSMFLWGQLDGKKGAIDVISCLHAFIETIPDGCKHLICWFDGTSSQLKNVTTLLYLLHRTDITSPLYKFERISLKYAPPGHTYMMPDRAFGNIAKQLKKREVIGNPLELMQVINSKCKDSHAVWLERKKHIDWNQYLDQYYTTDKTFMRVDNEPLLRKSRWFSFGFSQVRDRDHGASSHDSVLVQHFPNEIRSRSNFETTSAWISHRIEQKQPKRAVPFDDCIAYRGLQLENARIKDLRCQRDWLPARYRDLDIYNLDIHADSPDDNDDDDAGRKDDDD